MLSRATGAGPRNAFEYGHVTRIHVSAAHAMRTLALDRIAGGEQLANVFVRSAERIGDHGLGTGRKPACREVVGALTGDVDRRVRVTGFAGTARVAQVAE